MNACSQPRLLLPSLMALCCTFSSGAFASWATHLSIYADDHATHRPSEDYEVILDNELNADVAVGYEGRTSFYGSQYPVEGRAGAGFDLATGETRFYVESTGDESYCGASLSLSDTIYPTWQSGRSGVMDVEINWSVTGTKQGYYLSGGEWMETAYWGPRNWGMFATFSYRVDDEAFVRSPYGQYNLADGAETWSQVISFDPAVNASITIGESMSAWLDAYNSMKTVVDFSHTGMIELVLPEGAAYTSDSGVFLTIPEPASLILLALGGWMIMAGKSKIGHPGTE